MEGFVFLFLCICHNLIHGEAACYPNRAGCMESEDPPSLSAGVIKGLFFARCHALPWDYKGSLTEASWCNWDRALGTAGWGVGEGGLSLLAWAMVGGVINENPKE